MMHLCTFATLCFFKITFPRNYYYCNQDDTIPWVCVLKYASKSNCCHRHLVLYISDVKKFPYLPKIYISAIGMTMLMVIIMIMVMVIMMPMMLTTPWAVSSAARTSNCRCLPPRCLVVPLLSAHSGSSPLPIIHSSDNKTTIFVQSN